jgi:hypothetical protein
MYRLAAQAEQHADPVVTWFLEPASMCCSSLICEYYIESKVQSIVVYTVHTPIITYCCIHTFLYTFELLKTYVSPKTFLLSVGG